MTRRGDNEKRRPFDAVPFISCFFAYPTMLPVVNVNVREKLVPLIVPEIDTVYVVLGDNGLIG